MKVYHFKLNKSCAKEANGVDERITVTVQFITCFSTEKQRDTRNNAPSRARAIHPSASIRKQTLKIGAQIPLPGKSRCLRIPLPR